MYYVVKDRNQREFKIKETNSVKFLYNNVIGRFIVKILSYPVFSKIAGSFLSSRLSRFLIKGFVKKNKIDLSLYEDKDYKSFNDFFTRKLKKLDIVFDKNTFVSPADAKLMCYEITKDSLFKIKSSYYSVYDLLNGETIYKDYENGYALVFRLSTDDYHRYIYVDNGKQDENIFIPGELHTVRPLVLNYINIYKRNSREYTILHTENFDDIVQIEVGALLVGKINNFKENKHFKKGEVKGMFEFGGSTIVLLLKKDKAIIDEDILENSKHNIETIVKCGSKIGEKFKK